MSKDRKETLDTLYPELEKEPVYGCVKCGRKFEKGDTDYLTFEGNVYVGEDTVFIGNNIPNVDRTDVDSDKFRREDINKKRICLSCFINDMNNIRNKTLDELKAKAEKTLNQIKQLSSDTTIDIPTFLKGQS